MVAAWCPCRICIVDSLTGSGLTVRLELCASIKLHIQNLELSAISSTRSMMRPQQQTALGWVTKSEVFSRITTACMEVGTIGLLTAACLALYSRQLVATSGNTVSSMWSHKCQSLLFQRWYQLAFLPSGDQDLQNVYNLVDSTVLTYLIPQQTVSQFETSCA